MVPKIPVIDLSIEDLNPDSSSWLSVCNQVCHALEEYGCFVAVYCKLSSESRNRVLESAKELFDLPLEIKMLNDTKKPYRGYIGKSPQFPLHEAMRIDNVTTFEETRKFTNLMWPNGNDPFCKTVQSYAKLVEELNELVVRMVFEGYGVEENYDSLIRSTSYHMRLLKYEEPPATDRQLALPPHEDITFTSILHQNHVLGLEIKTKDGQWIGFEPSPSSFIVMAGDAFTVWSNDRIRSCTHRVIMGGNEDRYSIGLFTFHDGTINIPEKLVDEKHPLHYKPFNHLGYVDYYYSNKVSQPNQCRYKAYGGI